MVKIWILTKIQAHNSVFAFVSHKAWSVCGEHAHTHTHTSTLVCICVCMFTRARARARACVCMCVHVCACVCTCVCTCYDQFGSHDKLWVCVAAEDNSLWKAEGHIFLSMGDCPDFIGDDSPAIWRCARGCVEFVVSIVMPRFLWWMNASCDPIHARKTPPTLLTYRHHTQKETHAQTRTQTQTHTSVYVRMYVYTYV